jgi:hypothetical protein
MEVLPAKTAFNAGMFQRYGKDGSFYGGLTRSPGFSSLKVPLMAREH